MKTRIAALVFVLCTSCPLVMAQGSKDQQDFNFGQIYQPVVGNSLPEPWRTDDSAKGDTASAPKDTWSAPTDSYTSHVDNSLLDYSPTETYTGSDGDSPMAKMYEYGR